MPLTPKTLRPSPGVWGETPSAKERATITTRWTVFVSEGRLALSFDAGRPQRGGGRYFSVPNSTPRKIPESPVAVHPRWRSPVLPQRC